MFGLGIGEVLIVLALALVLLGPDRLPEVAKQLGKGMRELRKATDEIKQQVEKELNAAETRPAPTTSPAGPASPPMLTSPEPSVMSAPSTALLRTPEAP